MKIGVAIAPKNALPSAFVVWRGLEESIKKAAEYGYDGVELALSSKEDINKQKISKLCKEYQIEISAITTGQVFAANGLYLTHPEANMRIKAINSLKGLVELARDFGKKVNLGRVRGFVHEGETYKITLVRFIDSLCEISDYALKQDVELIIEPINRYETNFINNLSEGAKIIKKSKKNNIKLMPDIFHMNIEEVSITGELVRFADLISYIHFADSNRLAPGQGHLNFPEIIHTLEALDYNGWVTIEILPQPDPDTAAMQAIQYLRQFIHPK